MEAKLRIDFHLYITIYLYHNMLPIRLPFQERAFKIKEIDGASYIWDLVRRKYILITPEEMVRQHILHLLIESYGYPKGLIGVEKWIQIDKMRKRYDIVVYDRDLQPFLLVECKAPQVAIDESTVFQIMHYQQKMQSAYLMISNGSYSFLARVKGSEIEWLDAMPAYPE